MTDMHEIRPTWKRRLAVTVVAVPIITPLVMLHAILWLAPRAAWEVIAQEWGDSLLTIRQAWAGKPTFGN